MLPTYKFFLVVVAFMGIYSSHIVAEGHPPSEGLYTQGSNNSSGSSYSSSYGSSSNSATTTVRG